MILAKGVLTETHGPIHNDRLAVLRPRLGAGAVAWLDDDRPAIRIGRRGEARGRTRPWTDSISATGRRGCGREQDVDRHVNGALRDDAVVVRAELGVAVDEHDRVLALGEVVPGRNLPWSIGKSNSGKELEVVRSWRNIPRP